MRSRILGPVLVVALVAAAGIQAWEWASDRADHADDLRACASPRGVDNACVGLRELARRYPDEVAPAGAAPGAGGEAVESAVLKACHPAYEPGCVLRGVLVAAFGEPNYSEYDEELLVRAFFGDRHGGFFVDVGASHYRKDSTTYFLEQRLGWSGIGIDANAEFAADYAKFRPRTRFFVNYVDEKSTGEHEFFLSEVDRRDSTGIRDWAQKLGGVVERHIPSITLDDLLQREKAGRIDFLSMDIEMAEPAALRGFDIKRWRPALVCIEANKGETREFIERYFADNGYLPVKAWRLVDPVNLWYVPGP